MLNYEKTGATALICQTGAKKLGIPNSRFEWNPTKVLSIDVAWIVLQDYLNIDPCLLWSARTSRIDLAIDVPGLRVDDVLLSYPKLRPRRNEFGSAGRTRYLGSESGRTQVVVYDKRAEIIASNQRMGDFLKDLHESVPEHELLRLEVSVTDRMKVSELASAEYPFTKMRVHMLPAQPDSTEMALFSGQTRHAGMVASEGNLGRTVPGLGQ